MNGARSIFLRKGYWLTALAAIVLLAASPGTVSAQVTVTGPDKNTVTEGDTAVYTVVIKGYIQPGSSEGGTFSVTLGTPGLDTDPAGTAGEIEDVSVNLGLVYRVDVPDVDEDDDAVPFNRSGTIRVPTTHDPDAENEAFTLTFTAQANAGANIDTTEEGGTPIALPAAGMTGNPNALTIKDDETQTYVMIVDTDDPEEGMPINVSVKAEPTHEDGSVMLSLYSSDPEYTIAPLTATIGVGGADTQPTIVVTPPGDDGNRVEDAVTLTALSGTLGDVKTRATVTIKVADINELPAVAMMVVEKDGDELDPQPTSVTEGDTIMVAVMPLDKDGDVKAFAEELTVVLMPTGTADSADYTVVRTITIDADAAASDPVELEVRGGDDDIGMESLMFDATVSGDKDTGTETRITTGVLSLTIEDDTTPKITPKTSEADYDAIKAVIKAAGGDDEMLNPDPAESFTLMFGDLFDVMDGYTASYSFSQDGTSVSASSTGEAITVTAEMAGRTEITINGTARMAGNSLIPTQTVANDASIKFPVDVVDGQLVVTLSAEPMEIEAGGTTMITATANRYVTAGDGAVEIALAVVGDGMLDPESITIAMGDMSGSATLTANESVTVVATGSGVSGLMQVAVTVTAEPAPEPENQISSKSQDEAYPVITAAIATGAGEDEMLTYGESFSLMASDLFDVMEGYAAVYAVEVDGDAVSASVSGDSVSVTAGAAGEAKVTITGTAKMAASSFVASQDATNVASITFPVTVEAEPEPEPEPEPVSNQIEAKHQDVAYPVITAAIALGAGEDEMLTPGESVELMGSDLFTVMDGYDATYRVSVDSAAVSGLADGDSISVTAVSAGDAKVTITGTATMMAASSFDASQDATNVASITFPVAVEAEPEPVVPEPVPALPLIAQWLLGLGLMGGGARQLFRRRRQG